MMEFFHPYMRVNVVDNSEYFEEVSGGGTSLYQPFISDKGEDNVLSLETSLSSVIEKYGKPNFKRHGQAYYNLIRWIQGGGRVYAHRIVPLDAQYSNVILDVMTTGALVPVYERRENSLKYKTDSTGSRIQWNLENHPEDVLDETTIVKPDTPTVTNVTTVLNDDNHPELYGIDLVSYPDTVQAQAGVSVLDKTSSPYTNPRVELSAYSAVTPKLGVKVKLKKGIVWTLDEDGYIRDDDPNYFSEISFDEADAEQVLLNNDPNSAAVNVKLPESFKTRFIDAEGNVTTPATVVFDVSYLTGNESKMIESDPVECVFIFKKDDSFTSEDPDPVPEKRNVVDGLRQVSVNGKTYYADDEGKLYTDGIKIKHALVYTDCTSKSDLTPDALDTLTNVINRTEDSGWKHHYLMAFRSNGRGTFGDLQSVNFKLNTLYNDTYNFRVYEIGVYEYNSEYGSTDMKEGTMEFSTFPESFTFANSPLNAQYVMDNTLSTVVGSYSENQYDAIIGDILDATEDSNANDESWDDTSSIDFLFGQSKSGYGTYEKLLIDEESVDINDATSLRFKNGSNGSFSTENSHPRVNEDTGDNVFDDNGNIIYDPNTEAYVKEKKISLYVDAYQGITIPEILDFRYYGIDVVMDANFDLRVKNAILDFCNERKYHTFGYIDTGILYSVKQTLDWRENNFQTTDWCVSIYGQNWLVSDPYSGKDLNVTTTYFLANMVPNHDSVYGVQFPIAGPKYGVLTGYKLANTSWFPSEYEKEDLYTNRVNYVERTPNMVRIMSQCTAQKRLTQLTDQNHVRVLFKMVASVENTLDNFYFEPGTDATMSTINTALNSALSGWQDNGAVTSVSATASQTAEQRERKICAVNVSVQFTPVIERFDCTFEVQKIA